MGRKRGPWHLSLYGACSRTGTSALFSCRRTVGCSRSGTIEFDLLHIEDQIVPVREQDCGYEGWIEAHCPRANTTSRFPADACGAVGDGPRNNAAAGRASACERGWGTATSQLGWRASTREVTSCEGSNFVPNAPSSADEPSASNDRYTGCDQRRPRRHGSGGAARHGP